MMKTLSIILLTVVTVYVLTGHTLAQTNVIDGKYIREWLILGPFFPDNPEADFLANAGDEANIQPKEGDTITMAEGEKLVWKRYKSAKDVVNLQEAVGYHKNATAYVFCVLQSNSAGSAPIYLGSDDGVAVWINGEQVYYSVNPLPILDKAPYVSGANLKAGANRCLVKVSQGTGNWYFTMRIFPPNGAVISGIITNEVEHPMPNISVRLEQDGKEIAQTRTDASGSYRMDIYPVRGQFDLAATAGEKGDWKLGISLREGERRTLSLKLKEAVSIEGRCLMIQPHTYLSLSRQCAMKR